MVEANPGLQRSAANGTIRAVRAAYLLKVSFIVFLPFFCLPGIGLKSVWRNQEADSTNANATMVSILSSFRRTLRRTLPARFAKQFDAREMRANESQLVTGPQSIGV
jgi:hypothetical protein